MKKIFRLLIVILCLLLVVGCDEKEEVKEVWPVKDIIKYSEGNIIAVSNEEMKYNIKVDATSFTDYNNYIEALKTTNYYYIGVYSEDDDHIWTGTDNTYYISVKYIDSTSEYYEGYNVSIVIYHNMPTDWQTSLDNKQVSTEE